MNLELDDLVKKVAEEKPAEFSKIFSEFMVEKLRQNKQDYLNKSNEEEKKEEE